MQELAALTRKELVYPHRVSAFEGCDEFAFKHALLRDAAYDTLLKRARQAYHARAAAWLEQATRAAGRYDEYAAVIADHHVLAGDDEAAAGAYLQAGERARTQAAMVEALRFFDRALDLLPKDDLRRRWQALRGRSTAQSVLGEVQAESDDLDALLALAHEIRDDELVAEALRRRAFWVADRGDHREAVRAYGEALAVARRARDPKELLLGLPMLVVSLAFLGEMAQAEAAAQEALALVHDCDDEETRARALLNISVYYASAGDLAASARLLDEQVATSARLGFRLGETIGLGNLGYNYVQLGLFKEGRIALERAHQLSESMGAVRHSNYDQLNLALAMWRLGEHDRARETLQRVRPDLERVGDRYGLAVADCYEGLALEAGGDYAGAAARFAAARDSLDQIAAAGSACDARAGLARALLALEDVAGAEVAAAEVEAHLVQHGAGSVELPILAYLTCDRVFAASGQPERAAAAQAHGRAELMARAGKISDPAWRQSYLENVPEHCTMLEEPQISEVSQTSESSQATRGGSIHGQSTG
jgi:tetratricopeptide (TPR) repeat protein